MSDVTLILKRIEEGLSGASDELFPYVYDELRRLANLNMSFERPDHTLSSTALVHEAYVRLVDGEEVNHWNSRAHFYSAAAEAMRRILVEHARQKKALKRGGEYQRQEIDDLQSQLPLDPDLLLDLDEAIKQLQEHDWESAELLKIVLFAGRSISEAGRILNMPRGVAYRHWDYIRSWFRVHFGELGT